ncbi:MAG: NYN domain-containing protein [Myxococcaceae bacterium]|nr:NYN domain-containing protein [Myxococcaceae bacterium]
MNTVPSEHRIALFLDFENLVTNTGISAGSFDLQPSLDQLLEKGKVVFRRAYCDWSRFREAKAGLHAHGVELVDVPPSTAAGKNAADMRLVIDALELSYLREHIDTFVIGSGDSDFCPLVYKLRENGRTVIGLGVRGSTSPLFVRACDEFIYLKGARATEPAEARRRSEGGRPRGGDKKKGAQEIPAFVREGVTSLLAQADEPLNPSRIKETLVRKKPDFDVRELGFSTFSRLLAALEKEGLLKLIQKGRQTYVVPAEPISGKSPGADVDGDEDELVEEEIIADPDDGGLV